MLVLEIATEPEGWNAEKNEFVEPKSEKISLEHSLISLSKWESKWHKPFLSEKNMSDEEFTDYVKCMTVSKHVDPDIYDYFTVPNYKAVMDYIGDPMTATTISDKGKRAGKKEIITSELIYYWMVELGIPFECEKWHINRLLTLIRVCLIKKTPPKKMSKRSIMERNAALNAARKKQYNTLG